MLFLQFSHCIIPTHSTFFSHIMFSRLPLNLRSAQLTHIFPEEAQLSAEGVAELRVRRTVSCVLYARLHCLPYDYFFFFSQHLSTIWLETWQTQMPCSEQLHSQLLLTLYLNIWLFLSEGGILNTGNHGPGHLPKQSWMHAILICISFSRMGCFKDTFNSELWECSKGLAGFGYCVKVIFFILFSSRNYPGWCFWGGWFSMM